mgnify:CR=1 FL=1
MTLKMEAGKSYMLQNMGRNKHEKCLAISNWRNTRTDDETYLVKCSLVGYPPNARRYTDGSVFMCLGSKVDKWDRPSYRILTPDGKIAYLFPSGNKTKFRELT